MVSFTVHGPAVLAAGQQHVRLGRGATRVELARRDGGWLLGLGTRRTTRLAASALPRVEGGRVTDRLSGSGPARLLGARLVGGIVRDDWLPGRLARTGAWMRGMPAAALWRIARLDRVRRHLWLRRALAATLRLRGSERADTHDLGFLYGEGAAYGFDTGCRGKRRAPLTAARCRALRESATAAADRLALMVRANAPAMVLPTQLARCPDCPPGAREFIIDSMMNIGLLTWAGDTRLAIAHARTVASTLVHRDGCTAQAAFTDRVSGNAFGVHTHQGLSADSTWARGQAWAILGYARLARAAGDGRAKHVARMVARCWLAKSPRGQVPRFDLDATTGPRDTSAQAVAAAGLATLAHVDRRRATSWRRAARAQLASAEKYVSTVPPLGRFGGQTYVAGGDPSDENTELPIALLYDLEARVQLGSV